MRAIAFIATIFIFLVGLGVAPTHGDIYTGSAVRVDVLDVVRVKDGPTIVPKKTHGVGSGVYIGNNIVLTAGHVLLRENDGVPTSEPMNGSIIVTLQDDTKIEATVLWINKAEDIAALKIAAPANLQPSNLACRAPVIGEPLEIVGNKYGFKFLHSWGRVSGPIMAFSPWEEVIPIDVSIVQGDSGGPAYDAHGDVIGLAIGYVTMGANSVDFMVPALEAVDSLIKSSRRTVCADI